MKKTFYLESVIIVLCFISLFILINRIETRYTRNAKVNSIEKNVITFEDETGHFWEWEKEEDEKDYKIKEKVVLKMHTNNTDNKVEDDIIIRVKRGRRLKPSFSLRFKQA